MRRQLHNSSKICACLIYAERTRPDEADNDSASLRLGPVRIYRLSQVKG
jgi:hypothetical protein